MRLLVLEDETAELVLKAVRNLRARAVGKEIHHRQKFDDWKDFADDTLRAGTPKGEGIHAFYSGHQWKEAAEAAKWSRMACRLKQVALGLKGKDYVAEGIANGESLAVVYIGSDGFDRSDPDPENVACLVLPPNLYSVFMSLVKRGVNLAQIVPEELQYVPRELDHAQG